MGIAALVFAAAAVIYVAVSGNTGEPDSPKTKAAAVDLDHSVVSISSCEWDKLSAEVGELSLVSWADQSKICRVMQASLGRMPTIGQFRKLSNAAGLMTGNGSHEAPADQAYQIMGIVEARGQSSDAAIDETFETAWKVFSGSNGHVTPKDLNVNLRAAGPMAKTLSQDGIFSLAAMIQEEKKSRGE